MLRMELPGKRKRGRPITEVYACGETGHGREKLKEEDVHKWHL